MSPDEIVGICMMIGAILILISAKLKKEDDER